MGNRKKEIKRHLSPQEIDEAVNEAQQADEARPPTVFLANRTAFFVKREIFDMDIDGFPLYIPCSDGL